MSDELQPYHGGRGKKSTFTKLNLDSLSDTRISYADIIKAYASGEISENMGRALTYMLSQYLNYWRLEKDLEIEKRIQEIEKMLQEKAVAGVR